jgi:6-phosphogluconate dehydrogenase
LESSFRKLRIQFLRAELELHRLSCESLARKFEKRPLTYEKRADLFRRWEDTLKESHLLQAMLDLLESEEKEALRSGISSIALPASQKFTYFTWFYHAKDKTPAA